MLTCLACIAAVAGGCGGPMRADELGRSVGALESAASEGALLARGVVADRTKTSFVRVRTRELGETVQHEAEKLADASAADGVAEDKHKAVELADAISRALGDVQTMPADRQTAAEAEQTLEDLADDAARLARALA